MRYSSISSFLPILFATTAQCAPPVLALWARDDESAPYTSLYSASWGTPTPISSFAEDMRWLVARSCPTRDEIALGTLDKRKDVRIAFRINGTWGSSSLLCADSGTSKDRGFDIAYEASSGDAIVAYWSKASKRLAYRVVTDGSIGVEQTLSLGSDHEIARYISLTPRPSGDLIIALAMKNNNDLYSVAWNGSAFGTPQLLEADCDTNKNEDFACGFEALSGRALIVYSRKNASQVQFRTHNGSHSAAAAGPDIGSPARWVRLAPRPASNDVLMVTLDKAKDINASLWSGSTSTWSTVTELADDAHYHDRRLYDVTFEANGNRALLVYSQKNMHQLLYRTWTPTGGWSAELVGPDIGDEPDVVAVRRAATGNTVYILASNREGELWASVWNGSTLAPPVRLEADLASKEGNEQFAINDQPAGAVTPKVVRWTEVDR